MDILFLLQANTDTLATETAQSGISLFQLLMKGGFFMIPILILSILALFIFFERLFTINQAIKEPEALMGTVSKHILNGNVNGAIAACQEKETPIGRIIEKGLRRLGKPMKSIEKAMEGVAKLELLQLEKRLPLLATIAGAAPMVGFLGTVTGMIKAFYDLANNADGGVIDSGLLANGIYEALITTAAGLTVGIIAYIGYNFLAARINKVIFQIENASNQLSDLLQEPV